MAIIFEGPENSPAFYVSLMSKTGYTFPKEERLCSRKEIARLFEEGHSVLVFPLKLLWTESETEHPSRISVAFSVSSRTFRKATDRNLLKRRMREAYRLNKVAEVNASPEKSVNLMFIYIARQILPYPVVEKATKTGLKKVRLRIATGDAHWDKSKKADKTD